MSTSRYEVWVKQPGMELRFLSGSVYLKWAKDFSESHFRQQPWETAIYWIFDPKRLLLLWKGSQDPRDPRNLRWKST